MCQDFGKKTRVIHFSIWLSGSGKGKDKSDEPQERQNAGNVGQLHGQISVSIQVSLHLSDDNIQLKTPSRFCCITSEIKQRNLLLRLELESGK